MFDCSHEDSIDVDPHLQTPGDLIPDLAMIPLQHSEKTYF
jgi:hypothetical protein